MRIQAVGEPPISRWDYPVYSVYFEKDWCCTPLLIKLNLHRLSDV
jgi:hypothetical protein